MEPQATYTRGQLARAAGINGETIRYYEQEGLLPGTGRTRAGYRKYTPEALRRLSLIRQAKALGFTLKEIAELLRLSSYRESECEGVLQKAEEKRGEVRRKIRDLKALDLALSRLTKACSGRCRMEECPILEALTAAPERKETRRRQ